MRNITETPDIKLNDFSISFMLNGKKIEFEILANVKENEMFPVLDNWIPRTKKYTAASLVNYINSKYQYGFMAELKK